MQNVEQVVKCTVVGGGNVGKSNMIITYTTNKYPQVSCPTVGVFHYFSHKIAVDGKEFNLVIFDTEDSDRLRSEMFYSNTNVFILCFSIDSPTSLKLVESYWFPELRRICPSTPIILVGTKLDLRYDSNTLRKFQKITIIEGEEMAKKIGAVKYLECSAFTREGLTEVFEAVARVGSVPKTLKELLTGLMNSISKNFRKLRGTPKNDS